jgi:hypothetical protein
MSFDYAKVFRVIVGNSHIENATVYMNSVIAVCDEVQPDVSWKKFSKLNYEDEVAELEDHIVSVLQMEPAEFKIEGIWIGINTLSLENDETTAGIYFSTSSKYDSDNGSNDWACSAEHYPENGYFPSLIMQRIYDIAYHRSKLENNAEWALCLAYGLKLAQRAMNKFYKVNPALKPGYAVGFDSGDFIDCNSLNG